MKREIHHKPGSILNVMTIELDINSNTEPHFNKDRDEIICILEGEIKLLFDHGKSIILSSSNNNSWYLIQANTTHQIKCLTNKVKLLEVIGGVHKEDSCVVTEFSN
tara:strand:+ start:267 stop:584 length:318 start_codon:yes stop_codon:yes gene_type:complete